MKSAGLIYGKAFHYIDHLAPLCHLLEVPLIVTEEEIEEVVTLFYPGLQVVLVNYIALPAYVLQTFSVLFVCTPRLLFDEVFFLFQKLHRKKIHTIWCPHGNSDKGHKVFFMEGLAQEEVSLVYGPKMIDFLQKKGAFQQLKECVEVSNYRRLYYEERQVFYDAMVNEKIVSKLPPNTKKILYAPTWEDAEGSSSFAEAALILAQYIPEDFVLLVKPHPNLLVSRNPSNQKILADLEEMDHVRVLSNFPPIYPLLAVTDLYIGDLSSIGYDALSFDIPLFFLNAKGRDKETDPGLYLYRCGVELCAKEYDHIYEIIRKALSEDRRMFSSIRKEVYQYTFGESMSKELLRQKIAKAYTCFPDEELNFF